MEKFPRVTSYSLSKRSDPARKYPFFVVLDQHGEAFMDFSRDESGTINVILYESPVAKLITLPLLESIIADCKLAIANESD